MMATRAPKRRKLTPPPTDDDRSDSIQNAFLNSAARWDLEQDYETKPRKGKKKEKESTRLPTKTSDGRLQPARVTVDDSSGQESDLDVFDESDDGTSSALKDDAKIPEEDRLPEHEQIRRAKEELAKIALSLHENPEENYGSFKSLALIARSGNLAVKKICLVTQLAVYKDIIPGYRIRPSSDDLAGQQLSKDVRRVRTYEQALISGYQAYIKDLAACAKSESRASSKSGQGLADVAITCVSTLLTAVPHFNFRSELISILVRKLSTRKVDSAFIKCLRAFETLFREDDGSAPSKEAVSVLTKMMKARDFQIEEGVLNLFLHLRLLSEYSGKVSRDTTEGLNGQGKSKQKREFRTKRERKMLKEQKSLDKDMAEADALVSHEERERMQSDTLKMVFATYFRILKLRLPHLMGAVQEGLVKYAHLINQDFFGDLLEGLKDLTRDVDVEPASEDAVDVDEEDGEAGEGLGRNMSREALLSTVTAFSLLAGQDAHNARADLHLDLSYFVAHLYRSLLDLSVNPELESGGSASRTSRSGGLTAPTAERRNKVNLQTTTVLLIRCLTAILLPPWNIRSVPPLRLAAFTKQLMTTSLQVPEKSCQAILALVNDVVNTHGAKVAALWKTEERKGDGTFNPLSASAEGSNPLASSVWEGEILRRHYCPQVREGIRMLEKKISTT